MGMSKLFILRENECGMVDISVVFTLIFAAVKTDKFAVFLSTSFSPPHVVAILSKFLVFQESKGSPLIVIHPLKAERVVLMTLIIREYLLRKTVEVPNFREATGEAVIKSAIDLQKYKARASQKRVSEGR